MTTPTPIDLVAGDTSSATLIRAAVGERFATVETLAAWQRRLDERGLRATGSAEHEEYVSDLATRLENLGVETWLEPVSMCRWVPSAWALETISEDDETSEASETSSVPVVSYVAYSGATPQAGVTGPLSTTPQADHIGIVTIPLVGMRAGDLDSLDWDAPAQPVRSGDWDAETPYERVWLSQDLMRTALDEHAEAGAAGVVLVIDTPADLIHGAYLLYDAVHRGIPALFVGREAGEQLAAAQAAGADARLTLRAHVEDTETHNVVAHIPGAGDELLVLHSHTDGPNGLEDNGPEAIVAMSEYLASLPVEEMPRGVLVLLSTGHFAIEEAWGVEAFLARHAEDLVPRIAAALTLEHLGALPRTEDYPPGYQLPDHEFGCCFATPHRAVIDIVRGAMDRAAVTDALVLRPFVPDATGNSPDGTTWPGDGCPFWHTAGVPAANFITGPGYTFNVEPTIDRIDVAALRRQAIAFTEALLELSHTPRPVLQAPATPATTDHEADPR